MKAARDKGRGKLGWYLQNGPVVTVAGSLKKAKDPGWRHSPIGSRVSGAWQRERKWPALQDSCLAAMGLG